MKRVAVFGTGYVGCVTAACLSRDGHQVIGVDVDPEKVAAVNGGTSPIEEPGLGELVGRQVAAGTLSATLDASAAVQATEIGLITVGTPSNRDGSVSLGAVENVIRSIGRVLSDTDRPYTVVVRSTLLPGLLEDRLSAVLCAAAGRPLGASLRLCNNPEFLREGTAIEDYDDPPFVILGRCGDYPAGDILQLYDTISAEKILTDSRAAALLKYACNAFHAVKVAFANEIGSVAHSFGCDGQQVMELLCRDTRLNISTAYLRPGFAFGGSCLPKDLRALVRHASSAALPVPLLGSVLPSNAAHLQRAIELVEDHGARAVGLVGLSFKAGTDDLRESPFVTLAETLIGRGHDLRIYDPGIAVSRLRGRNLAYIDEHLPHLAALLVPTPEALHQHADLLVLGTSVADELDWRRQFDGDVIDLRKDMVVPSCSPDGARERVAGSHV